MVGAPFGRLQPLEKAREPTLPGTLLFPPFRLDPVNQQLWRKSKLLNLRPKTFQVLRYLVQHSQRLVTKQELLEKVWADSVVSDELLRGYVSELREVLGDKAKKPKYIETVVARGYRFLPHVESESPAALNNERDLPSPFVEESRRRTHTGHPAELLVGILHSLTGTMAWTESPVVDATLLAIEQLNQRGGVGGRRIRPLIIDCESSEAIFARQAERLIRQDKVCTLFGCWTSASRKAVLPILEELDHLLIYPTQYEGMEECRNIFYTGAAPNQQIIPAVRWAFGFLRKKRFFLVGWNSVYSRAANAIIRDEVEALGGKIVGEEYLLPRSNEVTRVVRQIVQDEPEVIFNSMVGDMNLFYTRLLRAAGMTPDKVPTVYFSISEIELMSLTTTEILGDYGAWNYFQSVDRPANRAFINAVRSRYGTQRVTADPMEAAYLGVHLWAQAVEAAGDPDVPAIRRALRTQSFDGPGGPVQIDPENQHTWKTMRLGKIVEGGQFEVVWSSEKPIRPEPYPSSRSPAAWQEFLDDLFKQWDGHWTKPHN
jgi:urea transport system substrate-binding protein